MTARAAAWVPTVAMLAVAVFTAGAPGCAPATPVWTQAEAEQVRVRGPMNTQRAAQIAASVQGMWDTLASSVLPCAFTPSLGGMEVTVLDDDAYDEVAPPFSAGFYRSSSLDEAIGGSGVVVVRGQVLQGARQIIQHEMGHRLVHQCIPNAPVWLHEGLASFIETADAREGRVSVGLPAYWPVAGSSKVRLLTLRGLFIREVPVSMLPTPSQLTRLTASEFRESTASGPRVEERRMARYAAAWGLVHFFELGAPDLRSKWQAYLGELAAGQKSPESAWRAYLEDTALQQRWLSYVQRSELPYLDLEYQPIERSAPRARVLPAAEVELHLARLSWLSGAPQSATLGHLERAAFDPAVAVRADLLRAASALETGQLLEAKAALLAVLQRQPEQDRALPLLVEVELRLSQKDQPAQAPLLQAVERARRFGADPWRSIALTQFELVFGEAQRAKSLSADAVRSAPQCAPCWLVHALALAATGETTSALKATERVSNLLPETADRSGIAQIQAELRAKLSAPPTRR